MSATSEQILRQALALPLEERAELIEQLLATFQGPIDPALDKLWITEAHDRLDAYDRGELEAISAEEVFEEIERDYQ
ncbi:MAG TPA: addiction module protein [Pyrinomonadaceae bacterium]|nr:addiction module protein [Pyrinomonadaceae bacterium]